MTTQPTELHVFDDGEDWYVAHTVTDAEELRDAHYGEARPTEMHQVPDGELIGILCDEDGQPDDGGEGVAIQSPKHGDSARVPRMRREAQALPRVRR